MLREARQATDQVWQRLAAHNPPPELCDTVETLKTCLASEQFIDSWDEITSSTKTVLDAYRTAYCDLFDHRKQSYESAIGEIKNRTEWAPLEANNPGMASSLLSSLRVRVGTNEDGKDEDKEAVKSGTTLGKSSLTEMKSDLAAVDGLKSSVLVRLQELSIGGNSKAPIRKVRVSEFFNRPIQTQDELDKALGLIRDSLQKCIDEGAIIILE